MKREDKKPDAGIYSQALVPFPSLVVFPAGRGAHRKGGQDHTVGRGRVQAGGALEAEGEDITRYCRYCKAFVRFFLGYCKVRTYKLVVRFV